MSERKHIDDFFKERLGPSEATPPDRAWENIETRLRDKKEKRRVIPFWWRLSGVAALLILGFALLSPYLGGQKVPADENPVSFDSQNKTQKEDLAQPDKKPAALVGEGSKQQVAADESNRASKTNLPIEKTKRTALADTAEKTTNGPTARKTLAKNSAARATVGQKASPTPKEGVTVQGMAVASNTLNPARPTDAARESGTPNPMPAVVPDPKTSPAVVSENPNNSLKNEQKNLPLTGTATATAEALTDTQKKDSANVAVAETNALEELLNEKEEKIAKERKENRWQVTPNIAPIYFSSTSNGSPLDQKLAENEKVYGTNYSYGLGVNYALNKRFSIRSGLHAFSTDYDTKNIVFYQNTNASRMQNVTPTLQGSLIQIDPLTNVTASFGRLVEEKFEGVLNQRMGYIEMPVELSYKILGKKFGLDLIGGVSTLFLTQNDVYLRTSGFNMKIGEANNLNDIHFSTNIGLGFRYNFLKRFDARLEPLFKYQLNTFSSGDGGFKPYIFGLYSGISYHF